MGGDANAMTWTPGPKALDSERGRGGVAGILAVVPPADEGHRASSPTAMIAGLPLLQRIVLAARAAGYAEVLVAADGEHPVASRAHAEPIRLVLLPANVIPQPAWLRSLLTTAVERDRIFVDDSMTAVVETTNPDVVLEAIGRRPSASALVEELRAKFAEGAWPFDTTGRFPLLAAGDAGRAEKWLLRSLIKQREGFMSRHFERRVSLAVTRRLVRTRVTPNAMTAVSAAIGLASAPFFLSASPGWQLAGALLLLTHSILDGCDGEIARLKFLESPRGAMLDYWGDNVVHVAVFACIALGWSHATGSVWPLIAGAVVVAATLGSAAIMFRRTADDRPTAGPSSSARLLDLLGSRDFIYLLIVLSAFGKAAWFVAAAAIGTPAFVAFALWLDHRHGRLR